MPAVMRWPAATHDEWALARSSLFTNCSRSSGLRLADFDLIEINEAFAAQVLACEKAMASDEFARRELGMIKRSASSISIS